MTEGQSAAATPTQPLVKDAEWGMRDVRLLVASQMGILGIVMGTFFYGALLPAFEVDYRLGWTMYDTTRMATFTNLFSMLGLFAAGPLADYIQPTKLLGCNALVVCIGLMMVASARTVTQLTVIVCAMTFARGVMWPAANVLLVANLPLMKHDSAFLSSALGSRIGDSVGPLLLAVSLGLLGLHWRGAVLVILAGVTVAFASSMGAAPPNLKEPELQEQASVVGISQKLKRLVTDPDGWLVFLANCGTYAVWSLYDYASVLMADMYGLSPGQAAESGAFISIGSALGLVVAFFATSFLGAAGGRRVHVFQSALSTLALAMLSWTRMPLLPAYALLCLTGFGFVAIAYVPFLVYAARSRPEDRAFRTAFVDATSQLCGIGFSYMYGTMRATGAGVSGIFAFSALCMGIATLALSHFYQRVQVREAEELMLAKARESD